MNFLCHAIPYLDQPVVAVCTAVPDWLSVVDRKIRARQKLAVSGLDSDDAQVRMVATGILHHIRDDSWFHSTAAFVETNLALAVGLRDLLPGDRGFRPMFVGHILIEVLLDAWFVRVRPDLAERYYRCVESVSPESIERSVNRITGKPTDKLAATIRRFADARFLYDYVDRERLLMRLNQVMWRVGLHPLPPTILPWLATARELVESRRDQFLTRPDGSQSFPSLC